MVINYIGYESPLIAEELVVPAYKTMLLLVKNFLFSLFKLYEELFIELLDITFLDNVLVHCRGTTLSCVERLQLLGELSQLLLLAINECIICRIYDSILHVLQIHLNLANFFSKTWFSVIKMYFTKV